MADEKTVPIPTHPGPSKLDLRAAWAAFSAAAATLIAYALGLDWTELTAEQLVKVLELAGVVGLAGFGLAAAWRYRRDKALAGKVVGPMVVLLAFGALACATVPIHTDADTDLVDTASQRLGFESEYLAELDGAIDVQIVPKRHYHHGEATQRRGCRREVVSTADSAVLAHELGHALGLGHVNDPGNVMTAHAGDDADRLTAAQRRTMAGNLAILRACREGAR